jgi:protease PrsW
VAGCWARSSRGRYRSEAAGLVLGVATAAGFASLETMGYGFASWLSSKDNLAVLDEVLLVRGLTSPAGHMAWTGLVCAVLWRERLKVGHATLDWRVLGAFLTAVVLHALWDTFASVRSPTPVGAPAGRIETLELVAGGVLIPPGVLRRARRPTRARSLPLPSSLRSQ